MKALCNLSLVTKQRLIIMLISGGTLLVSCVALLLYDIVDYRRFLVADLGVLADVIGNNSRAAIDFNDRYAAENTLQALNAVESIVSAALYSHDGELFASFSRDPSFSIEDAEFGLGHAFRQNHLFVGRPIEQNGEHIGAIFIVSDLSQLWSRLARYAITIGIVFVAALSLGLVLSDRLHHLISKPIIDLAKLSRAVAHDQDYAVRAVKAGADEIGQLVDAFNDMLEQIQVRDRALKDAHDHLEQRVAERSTELQREVEERRQTEVKLTATHEKLVEASRYAGMAEIASNVLHNVGNVLNSVNVSADIVIDALKTSKASGIQRVASMLKDHHHDLAQFLSGDPKGRRIPAYLIQVAEVIAKERDAITKELGLLRSNVEHINDIVAMQQSYATQVDVREDLNLSDMIEDSLRLNFSASGKECIELIRRFEPVPVIHSVRHKIIQILVNLIRNARNACIDSGRDDPCITVSLRRENDTVVLSVADNGIGILQENLTRIFNHGFTTRKGGHGFGLHSSAIAARELGGSLTAYSEGLGRGALFTLQLPI